MEKKLLQRTKIDRQYVHFYQVLRSASPISVNVTLHQLRLGAYMTLGQCLQMEYIIGNNFLHGSDVHEGVRALLIAKDGNPKWNPARIEDVCREKVCSYFRPFSNGDELPM